MNKYDDVRLDVVQLLREQTQKLTPFNPTARSGVSLLDHLNVRLQFYLTAILYRSGIYRKLIYSNLMLDWFDEFRDYWVNELGNRPLEPHDFYFLLGVYRQKYQDVRLPSRPTDQQHLAAWQDPRTVYSLFAHHYKLALNPLYVHRFVKFIPRGGKVCEYGCGAAPMTTSLCRFYPYLNIAVTCADIPTLLFHFARWKFRDKNFVRMVEIDPSHDEPLDEDFDVIFCTEVLEHLPRPMMVVKHLHSRMRQNGYFVFDFIRSEGRGLDTTSALRDRIDVLRYILDKFRVIEGQILLDGGSVSTVVCMKT